MSASSSRPPSWARLAAAALRAIPPFRGRGRLETLAHRMLRNRGWRDTVQIMGYAMELSLDDLIGRTIYIEGVFDRRNTEAVRVLLAPGATVFDVGANIGFYTLLFSSLTGEAGSVHAFEPVPPTVARLKANLALNPALATRIRLHEIALSDSEGIVAMNFSGPSNTGASHVVVTDDAGDPGRLEAGIAQTASISCRTGDSVWEELGRPEVRLIKMDVEGHELHALKGMRALLSGTPSPVVLVEVRDSFLRAAGGSREALFEFLYALGYRAFDFDEKRGLFRGDDTPRDAELVIFSKDALDRPPRGGNPS